MLTKLINPKTENFKQLKDYVLGFEFQWQWMENSVIGTPSPNGHESFGYYTHCFLGAPGGFNGKLLYSFPSSKFVDRVQDVILEILNYNNIYPEIIFRIHANCVHPTKTGKPGIPHTDHNFPHKNVLIYLTDTHSGDTIVGEDLFSGKEDDAIIFEGEHYHIPPTEGRRIVLVATYGY